MDPPYVGFLPNVSRAGGVRVWFGCCRVTYSILPVSLIWLQSWNVPKRRVNYLMTEILQRCAENAEIEKIEVIEQRWIKYSPSPMSCKEPVREDDLATKVKEWNAFQFTLMDARATFHGYKQNTKKRSVTETTEGKVAGGEGAVELENSKVEINTI
ncbi:hypothetical protein T06_10133 [Trichinella sp. T6]|nr:hypothetical protein T06_10133 [Trichinella sp. T6]